MRIVKTAICFLILIGCYNNSYSQTWESIGPDGSWCSAIEISKSDPDVIYAGTFNGGIFKSVNGGDNWQYIGLKGNTTFRKISVDPKNPNKVFVSIKSYNPNYPFDTAISTDGGKNWKGIPISSRTISYINNELFVGNRDGLFRSKNDGESFDKVNYTFGFNNISVIEPHPVNSSIIYLGTGEALYESVDGGSSWRILRYVTLYPNSPSSVNSIAVSPVNNNIIIIGTDNQGVLISTDGGNNWIEKDFGLNVHFVGCDNRYENIVFAGHSGGFYISIDFGLNWKKLSDSSFSYGDSEGPAILIYDRRSGSILKSVNNGSTWVESKTGMSNVRIKSVLSNNTGESGFFAIYNEGFNTNLYLYSDNKFNFVRDKSDGKIFRNNYNNQLYIIGGWMNFTFSNDNGLTWSKAESGLPYLSPYDFASTKDALYLACGNSFEGENAGIYKSDDGGKNWHISSNGIKHMNWQYQGQQEYSTITMYSIAVDNTSGNTLYAGGVEELYKSNDNGENWTKIAYFKEKIVWQLIVIQNHPDVIFAVVGDKLYKSDDFGGQFIELNPGISVKTIFYDYRNERLIAGGVGGIKQSNDQGTNWEDLSEGLENSTVSCLAIDDSSNYLIAGTQESGIYRIKYEYESEPNPIEPPAPVVFDLTQNYPNPFNSSTIIYYSLKVSGHMKLTIVNSLGQIIRTLEEEPKFSGAYYTVWDGKNDFGISVSSGIYFYRLFIEGKFSKTMKMIYIK